jgi:hypothetical protein
MMKTGRNNPCFCGSGKKYKNCCLSKDKDQFSVNSNQHITNEVLVEFDGSLVRQYKKSNGLT